MHKQIDQIAEAINGALEQYFHDLDGETPSGVYDMVLARVEKPLLQAVLKRVDDNQTKAADMLGINRNTLRKKLQTYGLL
ncbi:Fis family transcriptional regulator, factor for inversion stimulation protein [Formivibrio citricus]|uniref:Putative Fis-like DNA-binding protein n=1 Tax=Formivibrio citricus TaxID=83765 RepID=A0A1I4YN80_9NEIS|nr:helix-turn-helix domain-containing protein [Formivibrio citricus]SFN39474.1 Fis family transcriptional regulator, factor for inversion stimulation protein [Formivibrio citricus]